MKPCFRLSSRPAARQRGVVLFIALIVLVAMTLAGIGMMRSVDTATLVAGNLGFRQAAVNSSDVGVERAFQYVLNRAAASQLFLDDSGNGYYSSARDPDWAALATGGAGIATVPADPADTTGNTIRYQIHRMCRFANTLYPGQSGGVPNQCSTLSPNSGVAAGGSMGVGSFQFSAPPNLYYRITAGIQGPRNTLSYIQVMAMVTN